MIGVVERGRGKLISPDEARTLLEENVTPTENTFAVQVETTTQTVNNLTDTIVTFTTEVYDTDTMWAGGDATKIYTNRAGLYLLVVYVRFPYHSGMANSREHRIYKNTSTTISRKRKRNDRWSRASWMRAIPMNKGDYIHAVLRQGSGTNMTNVVCNVSLIRMAQ